MSKLRVHNFAISLDGYGAAPDQGLDNPLGAGGDRLHEWAFATRTFRLMHGGDVRLGGGPATIQQYLRAGLVDELHLAIVPILLGGGERFFDPRRRSGRLRVRRARDLGGRGPRSPHPDRDLEGHMGGRRGRGSEWLGAPCEGTRAALGCNPVAMPKAVRFERYGDVDVLRVVDVPRPVPGHDQAVVRVRAAGINPGEAAIRTGLLHERWPATFPSGQGSDLAGVVEEVGDGVTDVSVGDEVIGFTHERASQAELVAVDAGDLTPRPPGVPWDVAGALFVAGSTAYAAVQAVAPNKDDTVVVSGAAGGVGTIAVQLAGLSGATVLGLASPPHHGWLHDHGIVPVDYGDGVQERLRKAAGGRVDAFVDTFGSGYVDLAISLGVAPERIDTIVDWPAARRHGTKTDGNMVGARAEVLAELAGLIDSGRLDVPVARTYPLAEVQAAYRELERRHTLGKIVLIP